MAARAEQVRIRAIRACASKLVLLCADKPAVVATDAFIPRRRGQKKNIITPEACFRFRHRFRWV